MTEAADIAIVITTYNHARFLGEAVESVRRQTVPPAEVIVVDDGSTDHPEAVVEGDSSIRLIRQDNRGLAAARNTGWRASSSQFVTFLDADDWLRPNALQVGLAQLAAHPEAAFNYGAYANHYWPSDRIVDVPFRPVPADAFAAMLHVNPIGMHATVLYRRSALEVADGFAEELPACEDYDLYLRLAKDHPIACCPDLLAEYRQHDSNMSRNQAFMLRSVLRVMRRIAPAAQAQVKMRDWHKGVTDWTDYYLDRWAGQISDFGISGEALRQFGSLLAIAPAKTVSRATRGAMRRLLHR